MIVAKLIWLYQKIRLIWLCIFIQIHLPINAICRSARSCLTSNSFICCATETKSISSSGIAFWACECSYRYEGGLEKCIDLGHIYTCSFWKSVFTSGWNEPLLTGKWLPLCSSQVLFLPEHPTKRSQRSVDVMCSLYPVGTTSTAPWVIITLNITVGGLTNNSNGRISGTLLNGESILSLFPHLHFIPLADYIWQLLYGESRSMWIHMEFWG